MTAKTIENRLEGKAAVVTGGASGLGQAVVEALVAEGAAVVVLDISAERAEQVVAGCAGLEGRAVAHVGDLAEERTIVEAIECCQEEFGALDILHNNAGWQKEAPLHETTNEDWQRMLALNLTAVFWGCKHAIEPMRAAGGGSIVNTGSILSFTADAMVPAYCATKAGVIGLTRAVALAYIEDGIRCNAVCPGDMDTPLTRGYFQATDDPVATRKELEQASPIKRLADPAEVATAVAYLASDQASFVNGSAFTVDGGLTIKTY